VEEAFAIPESREASLVKQVFRVHAITVMDVYLHSFFISEPDED
jgi:hypothetical protein